MSRLWTRVWSRLRQGLGGQGRKEQPPEPKEPKADPVSDQIEEAAQTVERYGRLVAMYRKQTVADRGGISGDRRER